MKTRLFIHSILLASLLPLVASAAETATKKTTAPTAPAAPSDPEVKANFEAINAKIRANKRSRADLADEIKAFDDLIAAKRKTAPESAAYAAYMKATLFLQVFQDTENGNAMLKAVPADFPGTHYAGRAQSLLDSLERKAKAEAQYAIGKKFPDFAETDLDGKPLALANFKGKVVLVDFWATWCGPCISELPHVKETYAKHHASGFEIVGISLDSDRKKLTDFLAKNQMPWPQHFDGGGWKNKLAQQYSIQSIPATFLLDGEGNIIAKNLRGDALETAVAKALKK
jgi:peroxiredoxin